ncbi:hypothetical protein J6590_044186 [Homalodisca vitripennis]|nr:hypothetical protein J6590_044186 [Homalodisca vitripennis]
MSTGLRRLLSKTCVGLDCRNHQNLILLNNSGDSTKVVTIFFNSIKWKSRAWPGRLKSKQPTCSCSMLSTDTLTYWSSYVNDSEEPHLDSRELFNLIQLLGSMCTCRPDGLVGKQRGYHPDKAPDLLQLIYRYRNCGGSVMLLQTKNERLVSTSD